MVGLLVALVAASYYMAQNNFSDSAILWSRILILIAGLAILWRYIIRLLVRPPSLTRVARFLEERFPSLQDRLSTSLEIDSPGSEIHPDIRSLVRMDAARKLRYTETPRFYWPRNSMGAMVAIIVSILVFLVLTTSGPPAFNYSLGKLLGSWVDDDPEPLYSISVRPGGITVGERADLEVRASLNGFESLNVELSARYQGSPSWESTRMIPDPDSADFTFLFFDIREPIDYYVEADGIRSGTFRIEVSEVPRIESYLVTLDFPDYTGLADVTFSDQTSIRALVGTDVTIKVTADQPVKAGELRFESGEELELASVGPRELSASFKVKDDDYFRVFFANSEGIMNPASNDFSIEALIDQVPTISFNIPGRDKRVTNIEEVFLELRAEDDHGLLGLDLTFSVNGAPEQKVALNYPRGGKQTTASHTLYLEEFDLQPGDFVSYYASARDALTSESTDMYFLEVEPFDREYFQSQQGGGGGGGMNQGLELSRQQKQIIVGTFSLQQDKERLSEEQREESVQTLALVQQRLLTQAQTIVERLERRGGAVSDPRFQKMAEYLKQAAIHMAGAEALLTERVLEQALPEEQRAYQQLLRAESLFNEVQVAMSQDPEGMGSNPEDLADLVDLELDRTKNQYETLQQNRALQREEAMDEALEKLKELARRQEQQLERQRKRMQAGSGNGMMSQQEMADELERLARELARLSRQRQDQQFSQVSRELERAARDLRNASANRQNSQASMELAEQAMRRLRQAQDSLSRQQESEIRQDLEQLAEQAQQIAQEQREVVRQMGQLAGKEFSRNEIDSETLDQMRQLFWNKQDLQEELQELEGELHQASRRMAGEEPQASKELKDAGLSIRDRRIPEKMQEGSELLAGGLINLARIREESVASDIQDLAEKVRNAENALGKGRPESGQERLQQALEEAGRLVENLESMKQSVEQQRAEQAQGEGEGQSPSDQEGNRAEPNQGEEGSQSASEGQQPRQGGQQSGSIGQMPRMASSGPAGSLGIDPEQFGREWRQRMEEAQELSQSLRQDAELGREARRLLQRMQQFDPSRVFSDEEEVRRLRATIIDGFHQLELQINQALQDSEEQFLRPVNPDEVPAGFREQVEEYYRSLGETLLGAGEN